MRKLTVGYVVDRFEGNGGGLGAAAGILTGIGLYVPKPGSKRWKFSQWLGNKFGTKFGPRSISKDEDLPAWWKDARRGADGF